MSNITGLIAIPKANGIAIPINAIAPAFRACVARSFGSLSWVKKMREENEGEKINIEASSVIAA